MAASKRKFSTGILLFWWVRLLNKKKNNHRLLCVFSRQITAILKITDNYIESNLEWPTAESFTTFHHYCCITTNLKAHLERAVSTFKLIEIDAKESFDVVASLTRSMDRLWLIIGIIGRLFYYYRKICRNWRRKLIQFGMPVYWWKVLPQKII